MTKTVDDLRNEIREAVGRYERIESTAFTKEALAAVCDAVGADVDTSGRPSKPEMRAGIREQVDGLAAPDDENTSRAFRKADLETIAAALRDE
ncbi:hypothetical protein HALDL1_11365 [Halobacterium sp. DL1]|jgi:hypothetical protein|nr:hypothetical protein HALDL1_11365 [Halobacterium sp. DL1]